MFDKLNSCVSTQYSHPSYIHHHEQSKALPSQPLIVRASLLCMIVNEPSVNLANTCTMCRCMCPVVYLLSAPPSCSY